MHMAKGLSTCNNIGAQAQCLKSNGLSFVFRYYSTSDWKRLDKPEATALAAAGLSLAVVYEDGPKKHCEDGYFTKDRGQRHGPNAYEWANEVIDQPKGSAIYFAVDFDYTDQNNLDGITHYFEAVRDAILQQSGGTTADYLIGVYGSGKVCQLIKDTQQLAEYSWLAESPGWTGSADYESRCDVLQSKVQSTICGLTKNDYEDCTSNSGFGDFTLPTAELHPVLERLVRSQFPSAIGTRPHKPRTRRGKKPKRRKK
jgi:hypothetical protein